MCVCERERETERERQRQRDRDLKIMRTPSSPVRESERGKER